MECKDGLKKLVLDKWDDGCVVFATIDGLSACRFDDFVRQPLDGMLYDINRDTATILTFLDDPKWVNDYALTRLLEYYYARCQKLERELEKYGKEEEE
ncbi:MAG: hypothetical protein VZR06_11860 [Butyrivibrio sp.]|nr:hypothetical protein [Butyrivibrio sp.]